MKQTLWGRALSLLLTLSLMASLLPAALAAGEDGGGTGDTPEASDVTIALDTDQIAMHPGDDDQHIRATLKGTDEKLPITWASDNKDVVTLAPREGDNTIVDLTAHKAGTAIISASVTPPGAKEPVVAECTVTVTPSNVTGVSVYPAEIQLAPGAVRQLEATVTPDSADQTVKWESSDPSVAAVDDNGLVTAKAAGEAAITATAGNYKAKCVVTVEGIVLESTSLTLRERETHTLQYHVYGVKDSVTWESSQPDIVRASGNYLYALAEGEATITATVDGTTYSVSCRVTVKKNTAAVIGSSASAGDPLRFSDIQSQMEDRCRTVLGRSLQYIGGLSVSTSQGTLYYRYQSESDTGLGVGTGELFYTNPGSGRYGLSDVTFVPKPDFSGTAVISYTGYADATTFFQGTIEVEVEEPDNLEYSITGQNALQFNAEDFNRICLSRTGRTLSYVVFSLPAADRGTLYYNYISPESYGGLVEAGTQYRRSSSPNLSDVYFVAAGGFRGEAIVSYTGYDSYGTAFRGHITIHVSAESGAGDLNYSITQGGRLTLDDDDFDDLSRDLTGYALDYVRFTLPEASEGILYYNYSGSGSGTRVTEGRNYYQNSSPYLRRVSFVAHDDFTGTVELRFTAWDVKGNRFSGTIEIAVGSGASGDIRYSTYEEGRVTFDDNDFNELSLELTGSSLRYVRFQLPSPAVGTLYYNYRSGSYDSKVVENRSYYRSSSPYLDRITFVPARGFNGTASVSFEGWSMSGERFSGRVDIDVGSVGGGDIHYSVYQNGRVTFDDDDFNELSLELTGRSLRYVRFTLPSSSVGTLYYNASGSSSGSRVTAGQNYYRTSSPYLEKVSFVPRSGYIGTAVVEFSAWNINGERFTGAVEIQVNGTGSGDIRYTADRSGEITFDDADFNDLSLDLTGSNLRYVRFDLPPSSVGALYYDYSSGNYESRVTEGRSYYRGSSPYLDRVTFVARSGFSGAASVGFTGWSTSGEQFSGTVEIQVEGGTLRGDIRYSAYQDGQAAFDDDDFNDLCRDLTGGTLQYVRFELPSASEGVLYYESSSGSRVTESRNYYRSSSPYLNRVIFVPDEDFTGTSVIRFTGWSTGNEQFEGTVRITVREPAGPSAITYSTEYAPVTFRSQDFSTACANRGMGSLVSVQFTPPSASAGRLYYRYEGLTGNSSEVRANTTYYPSGSPGLSEVTFVPRAGYQGTVTISYTGRDSRDKTYQGEIRITVQPSGSSRHFSDMGGHGWAAASVDLLYENQVVGGVGNGRYGPANQITRGDFALMVCRAFGLSASGGSGFPDVPADSYYADAIRTAQALGLIGGYPDGGFHPGDPVTRQDAMVLLLRAMQAAGWSTGGGNTALLNGFQDGGTVSDYARSAMALMVEYGVVNGDANRRLNPQAYMSRAEMAVALARVLTY